MSEPKRKIQLKNPDDDFQVNERVVLVAAFTAYEGWVTHRTATTMRVATSAPPRREYHFRIGRSRFYGGTWECTEYGYRAYRPTPELDAKVRKTVSEAQDELLDVSFRSFCDDLTERLRILRRDASGREELLQLCRIYYADCL